MLFIVFPFRWARRRRGSSALPIITAVRSNYFELSFRRFVRQTMTRNNSDAHPIFGSNLGIISTRNPLWGPPTHAHRHCTALRMGRRSDNDQSTSIKAWIDQNPRKGGGKGEKWKSFRFPIETIRLKQCQRGARSRRGSSRSVSALSISRESEPRAPRRISTEKVRAQSEHDRKYLMTGTLHQVNLDKCSKLADPNEIIK